MGLLSTEVEVTLHGRNIPHYENLGYKIPRTKNKYGRMTVLKNTTIMVKFEDLPSGSSVQIKHTCDCCNKELIWNYTDYIRRNRDGKRYCNKCAKKILNGGENSHFWNPNKTDEERELDRKYPEYTEFIKRVLARDNYTCQCCGKDIMNDAEVHHLDGYNWCREKRTDDTNAVTLCDNCHANFHSIYGRGNNTREQYEEWIGYSLDYLTKYSGELPTARKIFDYERNQIYNSEYEYAKIYNVDVAQIHRCCSHKVSYQRKVLKDGTESIQTSRTNVVAGHHLFWLDEYEKMTQEELNTYFENCKNKKFRKTICKTTGEIFENLTEIISKYNVDKSCVVKCCKGKTKSCGKLPYGTPLQWMYYEDFLKLPQEEQNEILSKNKDSSKDGSFIMQ